MLLQLINDFVNKCSIEIGRNPVQEIVLDELIWLRLFETQIVQMQNPDGPVNNGFMGDVIILNTSCGPVYLKKSSTRMVDS